MCATEPVPDMVARRRLQCLGHIARMDDHRLPKAVLFSWLHTPRPAQLPRRRWHDVVRDDLKEFGLYTGRYDLAAERGEWIQSISCAIVARHLRIETTAKSVCCAICERLFATESVLRRHKCREERLKPIHEQAGAVLCETCHRWFASRGGFAVHSCSPSLG